MSKHKVGDTVQIVGTIEQVTSEDYLVDCGACLSGYVSEKRVVKTYEEGLADAWEAARKICCNHDDGGLCAEEISRIFGTVYPANVIVDNTPQEAIAKIIAYDDSKEIRRGDEVANIRQGIKGIVIDTYQKPIEEKMIRVLWPSLYLIDYNKDEVEEKIEKTGRNFADKLDALLGEIGEKE